MNRVLFPPDMPATSSVWRQRLVKVLCHFVMELVLAVAVWLGSEPAGADGGL